MQQLATNRTTWHITFGTYGSRLHGDNRPTVDRKHNHRGEAFLPANPQRKSANENRLLFGPVKLTVDQCRFIQNEIPELCTRGGWQLRVCAAAPDHVHVLLDISPEIHGQQVRGLLKHWLSQTLSHHWPLPKDATWWAEGGSNKAIHDPSYLDNAFKYILRQRMV